MPMKILLICCLLAMSNLTHVVSAQVKLYNVIFSGKNVGSLKVFGNGSKDTNTEFYKIESKFKLLFYSGTYVTESNFEDGKLRAASSAHHVNGNLKGKTLTTAGGDPIYEVKFLGEEAPKINTKHLNFDINHTVTSLYYKEPIDIKEVYSERYAKMCNVKKLTANSYGVELPDGKQGVYIYSKGQCSEVQTDLGGFKLRIVLQEDK
jgi:hypothetical protein